MSELRVIKSPQQENDVWDGDLLLGISALSNLVSVFRRRYYGLDRDFDDKLESAENMLWQASAIVDKRLPDLTF